MIDISNLIKVSTYARDKKVAPKTVYDWLLAGRIKGAVIDGVQFVLLEPEKVA